MDPVAIVFVILVGAVLLFVSNRVPLGVVALGVSLALYLTGVLDLSSALSGFGDPTVLFIAALFVVSEALESSGVIAWAGQQVIERAGTRRVPLVLLLGLLTAAATALISVNGSVAAFLPLVVVVAMRAGIAPSQMLLPLAFAAHAGSMLALTGTPVNILVSDAAAEFGPRPFQFFEFALAGIPLLIGALAIIVFLGPRLLSHRHAPSAPLDVTTLAEQLRADYDLSPGDISVSSQRGITEVVVPPRSPLIGKHVFAGMSDAEGHLVILAIRRGEDLVEGMESRLQAGDQLLLDGSWEALNRRTSGNKDFLVVDHPDDLRRGVPLGEGAKRTLVVTGVMLALLITGVVPAAVSGLLAACALVLLNVVTPTRAYRAISWTTVVLVAGMIPLSTAFQSTGAAQLIADLLMRTVGDFGPTAALAAIALVTMVLGQLISNTATVLIMIPIAVALSQSMGASPLTFLMGLTVAGAAAFITPFATPANLMVMEPGQYRFGDYAKFGVPFMVLFFCVAVFWVPVVWPFTG